MLSPPAGDLATLERTRDLFMARAAKAGLHLEFTPEIREWTRPSLISWRQDERAVAVPRWDELPEGPRRALGELAGSDDAARPLFDWLFRWFFVPHELTHALQTNLGSTDDHATSERFANDVAVAFYMQQPGGREQLDQLLRVVVDLLPRLRPLPPGPDDYFNLHYDALGRDPSLYGSFQLRFVHDSLARRDGLNFDELAARLEASANAAAD
jgi:hypothetical protein